MGVQQHDVAPIDQRLLVTLSMGVYGGTCRAGFGPTSADATGK
jgi:hypothetical protein